MKTRLIVSALVVLLFIVSAASGDIILSINKTLVTPDPSVSSEMTFLINVTNSGNDSAINTTIKDQFNASRFNITNAVLWGGGPMAWDSYSLTGDLAEVEWWEDISGNTTLQFYVNFTCILPGSASNFAFLENASHTIDSVTESFTISEEPLVANITVIKTTLTPDINASEFAEFMINVTNVGDVNLTNISIIDQYNKLKLTYNGSDVTPIAINLGAGQVIWNFNITVGEEIIIFVNMTAQDTGYHNNTVRVKNGSNFLFSQSVDWVNVTPAMGMPPQDYMLQARKIAVTPARAVGEIVIFVLNLTNDGPGNATGMTVFDRFNQSAMNYSASSTPPFAINYGNSTIIWHLDINESENLLIQVNFTAEHAGQGNNNLTVYNASGSMKGIDKAMANINLPPPPASLMVSLQFPNETCVDPTTEIQYNVNAGAGTYNCSLFMDGSYENSSNVTPAVQGFLLNLAEDNYSVQINCTGMGLTNVSETKYIQYKLGSCAGGSSGSGNYTPLWEQAQAVFDFPGAKYLFDFSGAPYVARGPGCKLNDLSQYSTAMPGDNCCTQAPCPGNVSLDLGAVWADQAQGLIAWHIMGPGLFNTTLSYCRGTTNDAAFVVEFDVDDNSSTGCDNGAGEGCYPGSDYQIWYFPDTHEGLFAYYNGTNDKADGRPAGGTCNNDICFEANDSIQIMMYINCSPVNLPMYGKPAVIDEGLTIIINKSALPTNFPKLNFETNSFNVTEAQTNPLDQLSSNGAAAYIVDGPGDDKGACYKFDEDQARCENATDEYRCVWRMMGSDSFCDPDFNSFNEGEACFTYTNQSACEGSDLGYCMWLSGAKTPQGIQDICVEQFKPQEFGSGDCANDCFFCYSQTQCANSQANGGKDYGGCRWYNDTFNPMGWCDITGLKSGCQQIARDCYSQVSCEANGWAWNSQYHVCQTDGTSEICFNGQDDNADGLIDCADYDCEDMKFCGAQLNTLTGNFKGMDPKEALIMYLSEGSGQVIFLKQDEPNDGPNQSREIMGFGISVGIRSVGMGIPVYNLSNLMACGGTDSDLMSGFLIDSDANVTSGCEVGLDGISYPGYEYVAFYGNYTVPNETGEIRRLYTCSDGTWLPKDAALYTMAGVSPDPMAPSVPEECGSQDLPEAFNPVVIMVEKASIGNPKQNIRFSGILINGSIRNISALRTYDTVMDGYYTPGTMDFDPVDCTKEPTKCGSEFMVIGGGKFMPFEDCKAPGDEDLDNLENCMDQDCKFAPHCLTSMQVFNVTADKTAPKTSMSKVENFEDKAFVKWTTNEPTNATLIFYLNDSACTLINASLWDMGAPQGFDDFRPWHDSPIEWNSIGFALETNTTYFYKIVNYDMAGNKGQSKCLNFTTLDAPRNVTMIFNFTSQGGDPTDFLGNMTVMFNGVEKDMGAAFEEEDLSNVNVTFKNPSSDPEKNWSIELIGANVVEAMDMDFSDFFLANATGEHDEFVGMPTIKWNELAQKIGVEYIIVTIPSGEVDQLFHCNDTGEDCVDITALDGVVLIAQGESWSQWQVPTSVGFSVYSSGAVNYTLNFTMLSDLDQSINVTQNATFIVNVTNRDLVSRSYNFSVQTGLGDYSYSPLFATLISGNWTLVTIEINGTASGNYSLNLTAVFSTNQTIEFTSFDDVGSMTLEVMGGVDSSAPTLVSNTNWTDNESAIITLVSNEAANVTLSYGTDITLGADETNTSFGLLRSFVLSGLVNETTYYYNVTLCNEDGYCATYGDFSFTTNETPIDESGPWLVLNSTWTTNDTAVMLIVSDEESNLTIGYGNDITLGGFVRNSTYGLQRTIPLVGLNSETEYYYNVTLCNAIGYCATFGSYTFETNATIDYSAPTLVSNTNWTDNESVIITIVSNEAANASVSYGTGITLGMEEMNVSFETTRTFTLVGLTPETSYYYNVTLCNEDGYCGTYGAFSFETNVTIDTSAPGLLSNTNWTDNESAIITLVSSDAANVSLSYGTDISLGTDETNTSFGLQRSFTLSGLVNETTYYYNVTLCNEDGYCATYGDFSFETNETIDYSAPTLVSNTNWTDNESAIITLVSNEPANASVYYGQTISLGSIESNDSLVLSRGLTLSGLSNETVYYYNVTLCNEDGFCATYGAYTFETNETVDYSAPTLVSNTNWTDNESVIITLVSNEGANVTLAYGDTIALLETPEVNTSFGLQRSFVLSGLLNETLYYYNVTLCNDDGYCATYGTFSFQTNETIDYSAPTLVSNTNWTDNESVIITLASNEAANVTLSYGTDITLGTDETNTTFGLLRSFTLTGLVNETTYYYNVTLCNEDGHCATYGAYTFETNVTVDYSAPTLVSNTNWTDNESAIITLVSNEGANVTLSYGTDITLGTDETNASYGLQRSFSLSGLVNETVYHYNVTLCNTDGYCATYGTFSFETNETIDYSAPTLVSNTNWTDNESAIITLVSNEGSNVTLSYGTDITLGTDETNTSFGLLRSFILSGLVNETVYYYNVTLCNDDGYCATYGTFSFETNETIDYSAPIMISNSTWTSNQSAIITIVSNEPADVAVDYGTSGSLGDQELNVTLGTSRGVTLSDLVNETIYYYNVTLCNDDGYCATYGAYTFETNVTIDYSAPTLVSNTNWTDNESAIITLVSTEGANVTLSYGTDITLGTDETNTSFGLLRSLTLSGLVNETPYYYNVTLCNDDGYCATYGTFSFETNETIDYSAPIMLSNSTWTSNQSAIITIVSNEPADVNVDYGTSIALGDTESNLTLGTSRSVTLSGLVNETVYYYNVTLCNEDGYCATYGAYTFETNVTIDYSAPGISALFNVTTNETAIITFTTDDYANVSLSYGVNESLGQLDLDTQFLVSHSHTLTGLLNGTLYYYNITACNDDGYCDTTGPFVFTTDNTSDLTPPVISSLSNLTTNESVTITFGTDDAANVSIDYGTNISMVLGSSSGVFEHSHSISLSGLINSTTYYFNVTVCNMYGVCLEDDGIHSFTTNATIDFSAPTLVTNTNWTDNESAIITLVSNEGANVTFSYGTDITLGTDEINASYGLLRSFSLVGLVNETVYYYNVTLCNTDGYCATYGTFSFETNETIDYSAPTLVSNTNWTDNESAIITLVSNEPANASVDYGQTISLGTAESNDSLVLSRGLTLSGLLNETVYYYNVTLCNEDGYCATYGTFSFMTNETIDYNAPTIVSNTTVADNQSALVTIVSNKHANVTLEYGTTIALGTSDNNGTYGTSRSFTLSGLENSTMYYYNVTLCNVDNYCGTYGPYNFETDATIDYSAPMLVSNTNWTDNESAIITLVSNEGANVTLSYGTDITLGTDEENASFGLLRSFTLSGLVNETPYYYNVTLCNTDGYCATYGTFSFETNETIDYSAPTIVSKTNVTTDVSSLISVVSNEPANLSVDYGTAITLGTSESNGTFGTTGSVSLSGLTAGTLYYFNVTLCNEDGYCAMYGAYSIRTIDTSAPTLVSNTNWTDNESAIITLTSNEAANVTLAYGDTIALLETPEVNASFGLQRSFALSGLTSETTYNYNVTLCNTDGYCATYGSFRFETNETIDYSAPTLVANTNWTSNQSAIITLVSNEGANVSLDYGTTIALGTSRSNTTVGLLRSFSLANLDNETTYYYNVTLCNEDGYCATYGDFSFTTNATIDYTAPTIVSKLNVTTNQSARVMIVSNEPANVTVRYGTALTLGSRASNTTFGLQRSLAISGLTSNTLYYYNVTLCNTDGYCATYGNYVFRTNVTLDLARPRVTISHAATVLANSLLSVTVNATEENTIAYYRINVSNLVLNTTYATAASSVLRFDPDYDGSYLSNMNAMGTRKFNVTVCDNSNNCNTTEKSVTVQNIFQTTVLGNLSANKNVGEKIMPRINVTNTGNLNGNVQLTVRYYKNSILPENLVHTQALTAATLNAGVMKVFNSTYTTSSKGNYKVVVSGALYGTMNKTFTKESGFISVQKAGTLSLSTSAVTVESNNASHASIVKEIYYSNTGDSAIGQVNFSSTDMDLARFTNMSNLSGIDPQEYVLKNLRINTTSLSVGTHRANITAILGGTEHKVSVTVVVSAVEKAILVPSVERIVMTSNVSDTISILPINISNIGTVGTPYVRIQMASSVSWGNLSDTFTSIDEGESEIINLNLNPNVIGNLTTTITVVYDDNATGGNANQTITIPVSIELKPVNVDIQGDTVALDSTFNDVVTLVNATVNQSSLSNSTLEGSVVQDSTLNESTASDSTIEDAVILNSTIIGSNITGLNLTNAVVEDNYLSSGEMETPTFSLETGDDTVNVSVLINESLTTNTTQITTVINGTEIEIILGSIMLGNITDAGSKTEINPDNIANAYNNISGQTEDNFNMTLAPILLANASMDVTYHNTTNSTAGYNSSFTVTNTSAKGLALLAIPVNPSVFNASGVIIRINNNGAMSRLGLRNYSDPNGYYYVDEDILMIFVSVDPLVDVFLPRPTPAEDEEEEGDDDTPPRSSGGGSSTTITAGDYKSVYYQVIGAGETKSISIDSTRIAATGVTFKAKESVNSVTVKVGSLSKAPGTLPALGKDVYRFISITHDGLLDSQVESATITFKVNVSWMDSMKLKSSDVVLYRYSDGKWNALPTTPVSATQTLATFRATSPGLSYFAISTKGGIIPVMPADDEEVPTTTPPTTPEAPTPDQVTGDVVQDSTSPPSPGSGTPDIKKQRSQPIDIPWGTLFVVLLAVSVIGGLIVAHRKGIIRMPSKGASGMDYYDRAKKLYAEAEQAYRKGSVDKANKLYMKAEEMKRKGNESYK